MRDGYAIDQIQLKTVEGDQEEISGAFGGMGGAAGSWTVPDCEYISKIIYSINSSGNILHSLQF